MATRYVGTTSTKMSIADVCALISRHSHCTTFIHVQYIQRRELFEASEKNKLPEIAENAWDSKGQSVNGGRGGREGGRERETMAVAYRRKKMFFNRGATKILHVMCVENF